MKRPTRRGDYTPVPNQPKRVLGPSFFSCPSLLSFPMRDVGFRSKQKEMWTPKLNEDEQAAERIRSFNERQRSRVR